MINQPGTRMDPFRKGQILSVLDMRKLIEAVASRIIGGNGVDVRSFKGRIFIEKKRNA